MELPFDTETKVMATLNQKGCTYRVNVKGAVENLLGHCTSILEHGQPVRFADHQAWLEKANQMAANGLRTLGFAFRTFSEKPQKDKLLEGLTFAGIVGFIDPPRTDVRDAIQTCQKAGMRVVMVTGDHPETARNIAFAVGILDQPDGETVVSGIELSALEVLEEKQKDKILNANVFARVTPEQKLALVKFYQQHKFIVGMTGDGVNDAPALKKADIGIAMGTRGTEAAKEVADVILRDDQFSSIELAIRQGRIIFENIRKFVVYLLSSNLAEIAVVAAASLSNLPLPLLPLQILYLNLVTDVFPSLALGLGEGEKDIMERPPRPVDEPIMPRTLWVTTFIYSFGITFGVLGISVFAYLYLHLSPEKVNNLAFYTLVLSQLLNVFNLPKRHLSFFSNEITKNVWVWGAIVLCILLTLLGYWITPLRATLSLHPLSIDEVRWIPVFSGLSLLITQLLKRMGATV